MPRNLTSLIAVAAAALIYGVTLFADGLIIARAQEKLASAVNKHPDRFIQLAASPLYQPLFASYEQELELLRRIMSDENQSTLNARLKNSVLFKDFFNAADKATRNEVAKNLFLKFARPAVNAQTVRVYKTGKEVSEKIGINLPELKTS